VTTSAFTENPTGEICGDSDTSNNDQGGVGAENIRLAYREVLGPRCNLEEWVDWNQHAGDSDYNRVHDLDLPGNCTATSIGGTNTVTHHNMT
jgi:hypothetical protein